MKRWVVIFALFFTACSGTLEMEEKSTSVASPYSVFQNGEDDEPAETPPATPVDTPADSTTPTTSDTTTTDTAAPEQEPATDEETDAPPEEEPAPEEEQLPEPGSVVEFTIAEGTGTGAWNTAEEPVVVYVGQVLRVTNLDNQNHRMHASNAAPVPHGGDLVPGQSEDYVVSSPLDVGSSAEMWDHNHGRSAPFWVEARPYPEN